MKDLSVRLERIATGCKHSGPNTIEKTFIEGCLKFSQATDTLSDILNKKQIEEIQSSIIETLCLGYLTIATAQESNKATPILLKPLVKPLEWLYAILTSGLTAPWKHEQLLFPMKHQQDVLTLIVDFLEEQRIEIRSKVRFTELDALTKLRPEIYRDSSAIRHPYYHFYSDNQTSINTALDKNMKFLKGLLIVSPLDREFEQTLETFFNHIEDNYIKRNPNNTRAADITQIKQLYTDRKSEIKAGNINAVFDLLYQLNMVYNKIPGKDYSDSMFNVTGTGSKLKQCMRKLFKDLGVESAINENSAAKLWAYLDHAVPFRFDTSAVTTSAPARSPSPSEEESAAHSYQP